MMIYPLLILFAIVFFELFVLLRMSKDAGAIVTLSQESMQVLVSSEIGDDEREALLRRGSAEIFKATCRFAMKSISIGLVLYVLFLLTLTAFPELKKAMLESLVSPVVIAALTVAMVCYALVRKAILVRL